MIIMQQIRWIALRHCAGAIRRPWRRRNCRNTGAFEPWLAGVQARGAGEGRIAIRAGRGGPLSRIRPAHHQHRPRAALLRAELPGDVGQDAAGRTGCPDGAAQIKKHQALFAREEKEFGVPASVITAFWGLESDFGSGQGKDPSIKSLVTLAYDCRRSEMFRGHLIDALRLIDRGDLRADEMIGSWAGELGQTQMMPSEYMAHAVDYDGDGKRNLIRSAADVIGSTGKYLVHLGWKRGEPWLQEMPCPVQPAVEGGRPLGQASALQMGGLGRHARQRQAAAERQRADLGGAAGRAIRAGIPRL